jgi:hypothetical protein
VSSLLLCDDTTGSTVAPNGERFAWPAHGWHAATSETASGILLSTDGDSDDRTSTVPASLGGQLLSWFETAITSVG